MNKKPVVDLIIPEYPDELRISGVSNPPSHIPPWNALPPSFLQVLMAFAHQYLHDDGALLMFYPDFINIKKRCVWISSKLQVWNLWRMDNYKFHAFWVSRKKIFFIEIKILKKCFYNHLSRFRAQVQPSFFVSYPINLAKNVSFFLHRV